MEPGAGVPRVPGSSTTSTTSAPLLLLLLLLATTTAATAATAPGKRDLAAFPACVTDRDCEGVARERGEDYR